MILFLQTQLGKRGVLLIVVVVFVFVEVFDFVVVIAVFDPQYCRPSLASGELLRLQL